MQSPQQGSSGRPVTSGLILACVAVYLGGFATATGVPWNVALVNQSGPFIQYGALVPADVAAGEVWRLVSSAFLHAGITHILFNMYALYILGSFLEPTFGRWRFLALYGLSGLSGGLAYLYFGQFDGAAVGASGAIFGLLGGVFGFAIRRGTFSWQNPLIRQLLILTAINLFLGAAIPIISNTAHVGGLVGGLLFGYLMAPTVYSQKRLQASLPVLTVLGIELALLLLWFVLLI